VKAASLFVAFPALYRALALLLVAAAAGDVKGVLFGAGNGRVRDVRILAVAVEAAFRLYIRCGDVVAGLAAEGLTMLLVGKGNGGFLGLGFVDDDHIGHSLVSDPEGCPENQGEGSGQNDENQFSLHRFTSVYVTDPPSVRRHYVYQFTKVSGKWEMNQFDGVWDAAVILF
jgi:hypothetical protein